MTRSARSLAVPWSLLAQLGQLTRFPPGRKLVGTTFFWTFLSYRILRPWLCGIRDRDPPYDIRLVCRGLQAVQSASGRAAPCAAGPADSGRVRLRHGR